MQAIFILIKTIAALISFYSFSVNDIDGSNIHFSSFEGKKVLIVNTSSNPADTAQYGQLEQLYQMYHDSLVIIAFPSDDFGNAPQSNDSIKNFITAHYNIHYIPGAKISVKGENISPLYSWLSDITKNGMMNSTVKSDFYKYLVNKEGKLIGIFSKTENPAGERIRHAIELP